MTSFNSDSTAVPWNKLFPETASIMDDVLAEEANAIDPRLKGTPQEKYLSLLSHSGIKKPVHSPRTLARHGSTQDSVDVQALLSRMRSLKLKK